MSPHYFKTVTLLLLLSCLSACPGYGFQFEEAQTTRLSRDPVTFGSGVRYSPIALYDDQLFVVLPVLGDDERPFFRAGAINVYDRTPQGWQESQLIRMPEECDYQLHYGEMVFGEDWLAIGAPYYSTTPPVSALWPGILAIGRIYIFEKVQGTWVSRGIVEAPNLTVPGNFDIDYLGRSLAADGNRLFAWSLQDHQFGPGFEIGAIYEYEFQPGVGMQLKEVISCPETSSPDFAFQLDVEGDTLVSAASPGTGTVHVYKHNGSNWIHESTIRNPFNPQMLWEEWGRQIAIDNGRIAITLGSDNTHPLQDRIFIYEEQSPGNWDYTDVIYPQASGTGPASHPRFGWEIEFEGDWLLASASGFDLNGQISQGLATLYRFHEGQGWNEHTRFIPGETDSGNPGYGVGFSEKLAADFSQGIIAGTGSAVQITGGPLGLWTVQGVTYTFDIPLGNRFCDQSLNSTGELSQLNVTGQLEAAQNTLLLHGHHLPAGEFGLFLWGDVNSPVSIPTGGDLCLGGPTGVKRIFPPVQAGGQGEIYHDLDIPNMGLGSMWGPGTTLAFQVWHRDTVAGASVTNMTNAVEVTLE